MKIKKIGFLTEDWDNEEEMSFEEENHEDLYMEALNALSDVVSDWYNKYEPQLGYELLSEIYYESQDII